MPASPSRWQKCEPQIKGQTLHPDPNMLPCARTVLSRTRRKRGSAMSMAVFVLACFAFAGSHINELHCAVLQPGTRT